MALLRRVIGDALRARRQGQHRTLRDVSLAANVSLGYLSEIERGQKEPSSELLAAICEALGARLSEVLREASDTLARAEPAEAPLAGALVGTDEPASGVSEMAADSPVVTVTDGSLSVAIRRNGPLRTTLHSVRARPGRPPRRADVAPAH